jgi:hypothetical protein
MRVDLSPLTDVAPVLEMRLSWKRRSRVVWMLMDTGATVSMIPPVLAEDLGLETKELSHPVKGVGGAVPVRTTKVYAQLVSPDTAGRPGPSWLLEPLLVAPSDDVLPIPLLGRRPFLQHHELTIREDLSEFVLRELSA